MRRRQKSKAAAAVTPTDNYQGAAAKQLAVCFERKFPALETVQQAYPGRNVMVTYTSTEFNSICPKTGLPDFADVEITYLPGNTLVELKSLKLYLNDFRNVGIFQEHAANKVFEDFWEAAQPVYLKVTFHFGARGGIDTLVVRERDVRSL